jgi:hypothetical protein
MAGGLSDLKLSAGWRAVEAVAEKDSTKTVIVKFDSLMGARIAARVVALSFGGP